MPEKVAHWLSARDMADPELQTLIEKQIVWEAQKRLGDYRRKMLLSLPPEKKSNGLFNLGTILYEKDKWPIGISKSELLQNLAIFGRSGAGKTNVAFHLLEQLVDRNIPFLFLDWKRTARHLLPYLQKPIHVYTPGRSLSPFPFNPFIPPPGMEKHLYINLIVDVMASAYTLGDGARSLLQKAISECYDNEEKWPTLGDVISALENQTLKERATGWRISALRALESLGFSEIANSDQKSQRDLIEILSKSNTIVELDGLNQGAKKFLIPLLCLWIYHLHLAQNEREKLKLALFVEEAHHVLYRQEQRAKESVMEMLMRQCREIGIAMIVIDQHPHLISSATLGNTYTTICLNLKDPSDMSKAAGLSLLNDSEKRFFSMLPVGQGIVKLQDRWRQPFLVQFPLVNINKGAMTDNALSKYVLNLATGSSTSNRVVDEIGRIPRIHSSDKALEGAALAFLQDVLQHQDDGVRVRYRRLEISSGKGNRLKDSLLKLGWLEAQVVQMGKSRKVLLRLTKKAREHLGLDRNGHEHGSLIHEYWKRHYARVYKEKGYETTLEAPRHGGNVDVLASKNGERIGIEIETGKSDVVSNVRNGLLAKFDKIIVVATDEAALNKTERALAKARLLLPSKVAVVLGSGIYAPNCN